MGKINADIELVNTNDLALLHNEAITTDRLRQMHVATCAIVLPDHAEPLRGQIPTGGIDKVIFPCEERLDVNPESHLSCKKC
jgi:hypothetical protein